MLCICLTVGNLSAQQPDESAKRALEREIKVSGNYLYGEAVGNTKDEAVNMAKNALVSEINKEALNHPEWQFAKSIQANDVEYETDMIDLMRGNKFRVVAYIKKDNLTAVFQDNKTPEVKLADKKEIKQEKQQPIATLATSAPVNSVEETATVVPKTSKSQPSVKATETANNYGDLLEQIVSAGSLREIQTILVANKKKGKASYGTMDKLTAPEKAYLVVYKKTGEIIAILDKGSSVNRKDLLSNKVLEKEIVEQNQVIWFQLY